VACHARLTTSDTLVPYQAPELDIVTYLDRRARTTSQVDEASARVLAAGMASDDPVFVSVLSVSSDELLRRHPHLRADSPRARVLRSVLMKPEHEPAVDWLVGRLESLAATAR
jgi:hypothetical protein